MMIDRFQYGWKICKLNLKKRHTIVGLFLEFGASRCSLILFENII